MGLRPASADPWRLPPEAQGLACGNLLAAQLVTAEGKIVRAAADENLDLLWALRTGNANFGAVTSLELRLRPTIPRTGP